MSPTLSSALVLFIVISFTAGRRLYVSDYSDEYPDTQMMPGEAPPPRDDIRVVIEDTVHHSNWGKWGEWAYCEETPLRWGGYAMQARLRTEAKVGVDRDDSSVNGIELGCQSYNMTSENTGISYFYFIRSSMGKWGDLGPIVGCTRPFRVIGFAINVEKYQGSCTNKGYRGCDDTATNGLRIICGYWGYDGTLYQDLYAPLDLIGTLWGSWQESKFCPMFTQVCGIQTQVDIDGSTQANYTKGDKDITGLNGVRMACCDSKPWEPATTTVIYGRGW